MKITGCPATVSLVTMQTRYGYFIRRLIITADKQYATVTVQPGREGVYQYNEPGDLPLFHFDNAFVG